MITIILAAFLTFLTFLAYLSAVANTTVPYNKILGYRATWRGEYEGQEHGGAYLLMCVHVMALLGGGSNPQCSSTKGPSWSKISVELVIIGLILLFSYNMYIFFKI